ncbi:uncharacterized protein [Amphiura filiformis]|uniref:uncharacterized protein n=1 Tax=Amphiura filiformis TaxID=82378 RepID=UPI003B219F0C
MSKLIMPFGRLLWALSSLLVVVSAEVIPTVESPSTTIKEATFLYPGESTSTTNKEATTLHPGISSSTDHLTGTIVGAVFGSSLAIIVFLISVICLRKLRSKRRENQTKPDASTSKPLAFDGPYDLTISGTKPSQVQTPTTASKQPIPTFPIQEISSPDALYHDIQISSTDNDTDEIYYSAVGSPNKGGLSVMYAKPPKKSTHLDTPEDGSLYYATSDTQDGVGWEDNSAYSFADGGGNFERENKADNMQNGGDDTEGWEDNALYN